MKSAGSLHIQSCQHEPGHTWAAVRKHGLGEAIHHSKVCSDRFTLALKWLMRTHPTSPSARYVCFCLCYLQHGVRVRHAALLVVLVLRVVPYRCFSDHRIIMLD